MDRTSFQLPSYYLFNYHHTIFSTAIILSFQLPSVLSFQLPSFQLPLYCLFNCHFLCHHSTASVWQLHAVIQLGPVVDLPTTHLHFSTGEQQDTVWRSPQDLLGHQECPHPGTRRCVCKTAPQSSVHLRFCGGGRRGVPHDAGGGVQGPDEARAAGWREEEVEGDYREQRPHVQCRSAGWVGVVRWGWFILYVSLCVCGLI